MFFGRDAAARKRHVDVLDGLRGLAVAIVLGSHLSNAALLPQPGLAGTGKAGVYLFFVLSAFLLTHALLQRPPAAFADGRLWANYALRRVLRIWPAYLAVLLLSWALTRAGVAGWHYSLDSAGLMRHLTLREGQSVLWSIPVEFTFYLWLPLVALALAWRLAGPVAVARDIGLAVLSLALATWAWPPSEAAVNDIRLGPYLVIFLCGAFAAYIDHRLRRLQSKPGRRVWVLLGVVAALACVATIPSVWSLITSAPFKADLNHRWFLFFGLAWAALLLAILHGPGWLRAPFQAMPLRWLGVISYSVYLWHMPVLDAVRLAGFGDGLVGAVLVLVAALAVSSVSFLLLERPFRDMRLRTADTR